MPLACNNVRQQGILQAITRFMATITDALSEFPSHVYSYRDHILPTVQSVIETQLSHSRWRVEGRGERAHHESEDGEHSLDDGKHSGKNGGKDGREERDEQTAVSGPTIVQWNWALYAPDALGNLVISIGASYIDRNARGLTDSSEVAIVQSITAPGVTDV